MRDRVRDSLRGEQGKDYDPNSFYVDSQDRHGHSDWTRVRFNPATVTAVQKLIATGKLGDTPIAYFGAFVRDALVHRMHHIAQMVDDGSFDAAVEYAKHTARIDGLIAEREQNDKLLTQAKEALTAAQRANDTSNAEELCLEYEMIVDEIRQPYQRALKDELRSAWMWINSTKTGD